MSIYYREQRGSCPRSVGLDCEWTFSPVPPLPSTPITTHSPPLQASLAPRSVPLHITKGALHPAPSIPQVFFLKAQYRGGEIVLNQQKLVDHIWVTKHEMKQYVTDDYLASVGCTLID